MKNLLYTFLFALLLFITQTNLYAGCTAREGLVAYRATLSAEDARTLRIIQMNSENVSWGRADRWDVLLINTTSFHSLTIYQSGGQWRFDTVSVAEKVPYDTNRNSDLFSWIDSEQLMNLTLEEGTTGLLNGFYKYKGKKLGQFSTKSLYFSPGMMDGKTIWQVGYDNGLYYDTGTGTNLWDAGAFMIDALSGKCVGIMILTSVGRIDVPAPEQGVNWNLFPNPASETVKINGIQNTGEKIVEILNMVGEIVQTATIKGEEDVLSITTLPNGVYYMRYGKQSKPFFVLR